MLSPWKDQESPRHSLEKLGVESLALWLAQQLIELPWLLELLAEQGYVLLGRQQRVSGFSQLLE